MDTNVALRLLLDAHRLKCTPRTGWVMRGLADAESVADHSFGVAFTALILAEMLEEPLDKAKVLTIALLHDLPESVISDIPSPGAAWFPPDAKRQAEMEALSALLRRLPCAEQWHAWWQEFEDRTSIEGKLVHDADRLDMLVQAHVYEQTTGNRWIEEFWATANADRFELDVAQQLYEELSALRQRSR